MESALQEYQQPQDLSTAGMVFDFAAIEKMNAVAQLMATSKIAVPAHFRGSPGDCLAVVMQAVQWGMNPYAVAQKCFVVSGVLGYEAQLINAVITARAPVKGRIQYEWFGPWEKVIGKFDVKKNSDGKEYRTPAWTAADETGCGVKVWATFRGEDEPRELVLLLAQARTRNSTLWAEDPRQQLAYLAVKRWSRLYCPDVIMGVYTVDELEPSPERDITDAGETVATKPAAPSSRSEQAREALKSRKKDRAPHTIDQEPDRLESGPVDAGTVAHEAVADLAEVLGEIAAAKTQADLNAAAELAVKLTAPGDVAKAREAYAEKLEQLKAAAKQADGDI